MLNPAGESRAALFRFGRAALACQAASGSGAFVNTPSGRCADLQSSSLTDGTPLQVWACNGTKAQKLRIDPASESTPATGALKVLGRCIMPLDGASAAGTAVVAEDCTGAADQKWTATSAGTLKHVASGLCAALPGGSTAYGTDMELAACDGTNGQVWEPADETRYIYGPTGERLLSVSGGERVLHLGDTTVATTASGGPAYTERYYSQPGASTVMRYDANNTTDVLSVQVADQNGTAYADIDLAQGNRVKFSRTTPYGTSRTEHAGWRSHRDYVGGTDDAATGLVHLGPASTTRPPGGSCQPIPSSTWATPSSSTATPTARTTPSLTQTPPGCPPGSPPTTSTTALPTARSPVRTRP
ncbi:hypothetical protein GTY57_14390 [Streptomyces sp. SID5475]|nr:RICIN domain-containing protein [Streptomyces xinghaiensis]MZE78153.1 hypothetical protein [Streptomyces sp. SID5475]